MKVRKGVQKLSEAVFCIPHRRDNAFFPSSLNGEKLDKRLKLFRPAYEIEEAGR